MIILGVEDGKVKFLEECEGEKELLSSWTLGDQLPYQAIMRIQEYPDYIQMRQIYVRSDQRRKGFASLLVKELEKIAIKKRKKIRIFSSTALSKDAKNFHLFLKMLKYKKVKDKSLPNDPRRIIFEKCF